MNRTLPHAQLEVSGGEIGYSELSAPKLSCTHGAWGEPAQLDKLLQAYAVEKAKIEARRAGNSVAEQTLPNGSIRLTVQIGGAA